MLNYKYETKKNKNKNKCRMKDIKSMKGIIIVHTLA